MFRSLRLRLAVSHALVLLVILVVLGGLVQFLLARSLDYGATTQLLEQANAQVQRIEEQGAALAPADIDAPSAAAVRIAVYRAAGGAAVEVDVGPFDRERVRHVVLVVDRDRRARCDLEAVRAERSALHHERARERRGFVRSAAASAA